MGHGPAFCLEDHLGPGPLPWAAPGPGRCLSHCRAGGLSLCKADTDQNDSSFPFGWEQFNNNWGL